MCEKLGVPASLEALRETAGKTPEGGTSLEWLARAARARGLNATGVQVDRDALRNLRQPALAWADGEHFLAVLAVEGDPYGPSGRATVHDPNHEGEESLTIDELLRRSGGILLLLERRSEGAGTR